MLKIYNTDTSNFLSTLLPNSTQASVVNKMNSSDFAYEYSSADLLLFELNLRHELVSCSKILNASSFSFAIFRNVTANEVFWEITSNGGLKLLPNVSSFDAISDISKNGNLYASECATAMVIVYYMSLCNIFGKELFDKTFSKITLMNWHYLDPLLAEIGLMNPSYDFLYGDRLYFKNPDVSSKTPQWQGENVIFLDNNLYYGHGIGVLSSEKIINTLNSKRKPEPTKSAYLMELSGRPNFNRLFHVYLQG